MLKKFLATAFVLSASTAAFAVIGTTFSSLNLTPGNTNGADAYANFAADRSGFDMTITTDGNDWLSAEITANITGGTSTFWHASNQTIGAPNLGNMANPFVVRTDNDTKEFDTFINAAGFAPDWFNAVNVASAGLDSTPTHISGKNASNVDIPLAWFDTTTTSSASFTAGRFIFLNGANGAVTTNPATGPAVATVVGRFFYKVGTSSIESDFSQTFYQAPEPSTLALLALGGLAGLIRRR